jgi:peptide/nickel transport system substrate-binding protein
MMERIRAVVYGLVALVLLGSCGPASAPSSPSTGGPSSAAPEGAQTTQRSGPKSLVWILNREPEGFSELFGGSASTHWRMMYHAMHDFLVALDNNGDPVERLAVVRPSQAAGTWKLNADGTMETTWKLRPNVKWHNGEPFKAADYVFGWRVARDAEIPFNKRAVAAIIDRVETPDDLTLVFYWRRPYTYADRIQPFDLDPFPSWNASLVDAYENRKSEFINNAWLNREFVGLGPYKLGSWVLGSHLILEANESWYGGKPKIDRMEVRFILDENARLAAMLSGDGDFNQALDLEARRAYQEQAVKTGRGQLIQHTVGRIQLAVIKHTNPLFGGPDHVKVRQAMLHALDREALAEFLTGERSNVADSWLFKGSPKYEALKSKVVSYPHNPTEALRLLSEVGWNRGGDGVLRDGSGQPFAFEYWQADAPAAIVRDQWQQVGMQVTLYERPPQVNADLELRTAFPGIQPTGNGVSLAFIDGRFHSRNMPTPANRFGGQNWGRYEDPEADRLIESLASALDPQEAMRIEGDLLNLISRQVAYFPYYIDAGTSVAKPGVTGIKPTNAACQSGDCEISWNIHEWDILR